MSSGENILILHPIYCGSHEFVLRSLGDHLVQRGHQVTQVRFKQKNSHMELKTNVSVLTLNISDHLNNCGRYVNDEGVLDIRPDYKPFLISPVGFWKSTVFDEFHPTSVRRPKCTSLRYRGVCVCFAMG